MYIYNDIDQRVVDERVSDFRSQTQRFLAGQLSEEQYRPLRLQNGLYIQRHAPMLRVAIPYGILSAVQLRQLSHIATKYDKGFGHFTTRQNIQFNWLKLEQVPDVLEELAGVQMHAIQTSGNCIRNVTIDPLTDIAKDSQVNVKVYSEMIRQWSTNHPEFLFLPRKFKIAVNGATEDRAAIKAHDIGIQANINHEGKVVFDLYVGGGLGRTPIIGKLLFTAVAEGELLKHLEAILRVYNAFGRRDNKYKARIKILVKALGVDEFRKKVQAEMNRLPLQFNESHQLQAIAKQMKTPIYQSRDVAVLPAGQGFKDWYSQNTVEHQQDGYRIVFLSLKPESGVPGDADAETLLTIADLAEQFSQGEVRTTHRQNLVFPYVKESDLGQLFSALTEIGLARNNIEQSSDMICCPGFDYCSLANAEAIGVAQAIDKVLIESSLDKEDVHINISGCMNACGHHHIAGIGLLGVDKDGEDWYQITIGGSNKADAAIGQKIGRSVAKANLPLAVKAIVETFKTHREENESMKSLVDRVGVAPFKEAVYE